MRPLVLVALALAGCAHAPLTGPAAPTAPSAPVLAAAARPERPRRAAPAGRSIEAMLADSGLSYVTVEAGRLWMIGFARGGRPPVLVQVVRGDVFTMVMGRLGTVPPHAGARFFRNLARRNFDVAQLKLGIDGDDVVYASFEVPSRLVDRQELLEDVFTMAKVMPDVKASLFGPASPSSPPPPAPPVCPRPPPHPAAAAPVIEAWR